MNIQEQIKKILKEENNFLKRRINLDEFEKMLPRGSVYSFYEARDFEGYRYELITATLSNYFFFKYNVDIFDPENKDLVSEYEKNDIVTYLEGTFNDLLQGWYDKLVEERGGR